MYIYVAIDGYTIKTSYQRGMYVRFEKMSELRHGNRIVSTETFIWLFGTSTNPSNFEYFPAREISRTAVMF